MIRKAIFVQMALVAILITSGLAQVFVVPPYGQDETRPICPVSGEITLEPESLLTEETPDGIEFDMITTFYDPIRGSVPIFVKLGDATTAYSFTTYSDGNFETKQTSSCRNSAGKTLFSLIQRLLILTDADNKLYLCRLAHRQNQQFEQTIELVTPDDGRLNSYQDPKVYFFLQQSESQSDVFIAFTDLTDTAIYKYNAIDGFVPAGLRQFVAKIPTLFYGQLHGNGQFLYSEEENSIKQISDWDGDFNYSLGVRPTIHSHILTPPVVILALYTNNFLSLQILRLANDVDFIQFNGQSLITSSTPIKQYTDSVANFVAQGSQGLVWYHQKPGTADRFTILMSQDFFSGSIQGELLEISLSGDKMVLFTDSTLHYWKIVGEYQVKQIASLSTEDLDLEGDSQYVLRLGCLCPSLTKFVCMSSTLNCIIIKKGVDGCGLRIDSFTAV